MPSIWASFDHVFKCFRASFSASSYNEKMPWERGWKKSKKHIFLTFSGAIKMEEWAEMGEDPTINHQSQKSTIVDIRLNTLLKRGI